MKKQWQVPRRAASGRPPTQSIQPGDSGIWATCNKGREGKCIGELRDLFAEYADELYGSVAVTEAGDITTTATDIENDIKSEIEDMHQPPSALLFTPVKVDLQCGKCRRNIG